MARRTCTLKMRPRSSVAAVELRRRCRPPREADAAAGRAPSARPYTAMPQPESCSSDWRISGFSASSSSCWIETGSADTQPRTRHMTAEILPGRESAGGRLHRRMKREADGGAEADLVGAPAQAVRARAARGRGEEPPRRSGARRRSSSCKARGVRLVVSHDAHAPQPRGLRGGGARVAPRAGRVGRATAPRRSRSCCRCCAASCGARARWRSTATAARTSWPRVCAAYLHEARGDRTRSEASRARPRRRPRR